MFADDGLLELGGAGGGGGGGGGDPGYGQPEVAISTDGSVSSSITRRFLVLVAAFPVLLADRFPLAGVDSSAGGRGDAVLSRLGGEMRPTEDPGAGAREASGTGDPAAAGTLRPARMERREPTGHSRQPMSSTSRAASSVESAAAAAGAAPGGGEVALRKTVERRGSMRSTDLSRSTITG
jgi:hypothetical protein